MVQHVALELLSPIRLDPLTSRVVISFLLI